MRTCTGCKVEKPLGEFFRDRSKRHGYQARCKPCAMARTRAYAKATNYDRKRYWKNPAGERERHLVRKYGVSLERYAEMLAAQGGCCAVCRATERGAFNVDHDHATGRVRGLLCNSCNRMIGHAHDSPVRLRAAADYLAIVPQVAAEVIRAYMEIVDERQSADAVAKGDTVL